MIIDNIKTGKVEYEGFRMYFNKDESVVSIEKTDGSDETLHIYTQKEAEVLSKILFHITYHNLLPEEGK